MICQKHMKCHETYRFSYKGFKNDRFHYLLSKTDDKDGAVWVGDTWRFEKGR